MRIAWLNDFNLKEMQGGCNISNKIMIEKGIELGHRIDFITPKDLSDEGIDVGLDNYIMPFNKRLEQYDLLIFANINRFPIEKIEWAIRNKPYIKYEHDYCYCVRRNGCIKCSPKCKPAPIFTNLFSNSLLNIFFSPLQLSIYRKAFGETVRDALCIPAPIETGTEEETLGHPTKFYPNTEIQRDAYLYAGDIATHKGLHQILDFADTQKKKIFHFAGRPVNKKLLDKIKDKYVYLGEIPHNEMPNLYRKYKYFLVNPQMPESFGITIIEALLSGCTLVKFSRTHITGLESYKLSPKEMMEKCLKAPETFWKKIEKVIK